MKLKELKRYISTF